MVNIGNYRNLSHLHLKLRFSQADFDAYIKAWNADKLKRFKRLIELGTPIHLTPHLLALAPFACIGR